MDIFAKFSAFIKNSRPEANEGGSLGEQCTPAFNQNFSAVCMVHKYPLHWIFSVQQPLKTLEWRINISTSRSKFQSLCHAPMVGFLCICCSYFTSLGLRASIQSSELSLVRVTSIKGLKTFCVEGKQEISHEGSIRGKELTAGPLSSSVQINFVLKVLREKTKFRESGFLSAAFQRERCKIFVNSWEINGDFYGVCCPLLLHSINLLLLSISCCIPAPAWVLWVGQGCLLSMWH